MVSHCNAKENYGGRNEEDNCSEDEAYDKKKGKVVIIAF